jgi:hypothetical protein
MSVDPWELLREARKSVINDADFTHDLCSDNSCPEHIRLDSLIARIDAALEEHDNPAELGWRNCGDFLFQADISETVCAQTVKIKDGWRWEVWRDQYETEGFSTTLEESKQKAIQVGRNLK